jgi:hypothetical protein
MAKEIASFFYKLLRWVLAQNIYTFYFNSKLILIYADSEAK